MTLQATADNYDCVAYWDRLVESTRRQADAATVHADRVEGIRILLDNIKAEIARIVKRINDNDTICCTALPMAVVQSTQNANINTIVLAWSISDWGRTMYWLTNEGELVASYLPGGGGPRSSQFVNIHGLYDSTASESTAVRKYHELLEVMLERLKEIALPTTP